MNYWHILTWIRKHLWYCTSSWMKSLCSVWPN